MANRTISQTWNESASGYCKMPDGTLLQWGLTVIERKSGINSTSVDFQIPFISGSSTQVFVSMSTSAYAPYLAVFPGTIRATGCDLICYNSNTIDYADAGIRWFAIGRWKA